MQPDFVPFEVPQVLFGAVQDPVQVMVVVQLGGVVGCCPTVWQDAVVFLELILDQRYCPLVPLAPT